MKLFENHQIEGFIYGKEDYRFNPARSRIGEFSRLDEIFKDVIDFQINPTLIQQIQFNHCPEKTPEGKALWLYLRLCQIFKYDEGYFYHNHREHPNDDPLVSIWHAGKVTADTPVTCFNFSRIAVKLLNHISGVKAVIISSGINHDHFRFAYYTDKVTVDADPALADRRYNDMTRIKLGLAPQGLNIFNGHDLMKQLLDRIVPMMLADTKNNLQDCISALREISNRADVTPINLEVLVSSLKQCGIDGASTVQVLNDINQDFVNSPYKFMRAGIIKSINEIEPQYLMRKEKKLKRVDLTRMNVHDLAVPEFFDAFQKGKMIHAEYAEEGYENFCRGLNAKHDLEMIGQNPILDWGD